MKLTKFTNQWLARSTLYESQSASVHDQLLSPLFSKLPKEVREKIYAFAGPVTTRFSNAEYDPFYRCPFTSYLEPTAGYLELDSEFKSPDSQTLRSVTVPWEAMALFTLCRRIRGEALVCLYRKTVLAVQPRALIKPSYIVPGRLALKNITKMHQHMDLPHSGEPDMYGQQHASVRALPSLLTAVESWDLLPNLKSITIAMQSRYLWGFSRASPRDKRAPPDGSQEAEPLCRHASLPVVEGFEARSRAGLPVPVRLPCRYNRSFFDLNQLGQPWTIEVLLHDSTERNVDRHLVHHGPPYDDPAIETTTELSEPLDPERVPEKHHCANIICNIVESVKDITAQLIKWDEDYHEPNPVDEVYSQFHDPEWREYCKKLDLRSWCCKLDVYRPRPLLPTECHKNVFEETPRAESIKDLLFAVGLHARSPEDDKSYSGVIIDRDEENLVAW